MDKKKIGTLSIRGPARPQISVIDMNILHEMAVWAAGEIDTISQQRALDTRQSMLEARFNLNQILDGAVEDERGFSINSLEKALGIIREAVGASFALLLKISPEGTSVKSNLLTFSAASSTPNHSLNVGQEIFQELALLTLKKDSSSNPLLLDQLNSGPVTKDVDQFLNKNILRCSSELVWSNRIPSAVLACFFEGTFHFLTDQDLSFIADVSVTLSTLFERLELSESFVQAATLSKPISQALRKNPIPFGQSSGLAPVLLILEPIFPTVKNYPVTDSTEEQKTLGNPGPKGQAHAQALNQQADMLQITSYNPSNVNTAPKPVDLAPLTPLASMALLNDFTQMVDTLADRCNLKRAKRLGNLVTCFHLVLYFGQLWT